jgi:hypothetical protein
VITVQSSVHQAFRSLFHYTSAGVSDFWFDCDRVVIGSGNVTDFQDYIDPTHYASQATSGNQCSAPSALSTLKNNLVVTSTGTKFYQSNRASSAFTWMHNGTGCTLMSVFDPINAVSATIVCNIFTLTGIGLSTRTRPAGTNVVRAGISNNSFGNVIAHQDLSLTGSAPHCMTVLHSTASSPDFSLRGNGSSVFTGDYLSTPTTSDSGTTLSLLGATTSGGLDGRFRGAWGWRRVLTAQELAIADQYMHMTMGVRV